MLYETDAISTASLKSSSILWKWAIALTVVWIVGLTNVYGQNQTKEDKSYKSGPLVIRRNFFRISFWDRMYYHKNYKKIKVNGLNLSVQSNVQFMNGINLGICFNLDSNCNGISIGGLASANSGTLNGISIAGIIGSSNKLNGLMVVPIAGVTKMNGVAINIFRIFPDTMNGFFVSFCGDFSKEDAGEGNAKGCFVNLIWTRVHALSGLNISCIAKIIQLKGVSISAINYSEHLHGVQFGLWNVAKNKRHLKRLPIVNFNFRREST